MHVLQAVQHTVFICSSIRDRLKLLIGIKLVVNQLWLETIAFFGVMITFLLVFLIYFTTDLFSDKFVNNSLCHRIHNKYLDYSRNYRVDIQIILNFALISDETSEIKYIINLIFRQCLLYEIRYVSYYKIFWIFLMSDESKHPSHHS